MSAAFGQSYSGIFPRGGVAFAETEVLVAQPDGGVKTYRCSDGAETGSLAVASLRPTPFDSFQTRFYQISAGEIAYTRVAQRSVEIISWPSRKVRRYSLPESINFFGHPLPPKISGGAPSYVRIFRAAEIREFGSQQLIEPLLVDVPGRSDQIAVTADGSQVVMQLPDGRLWTTPLSGAASYSDAVGDQVMIGRLTMRTGWLGAQLDADGWLAALKLHLPKGKTQPVALPKLDDSFRQSVAASIKATATRRQALPPPPPNFIPFQQPGSVNPSDAASILADPSLLDIVYTASGNMGRRRPGSEQLFVPSPPMLMPLSPVGDKAAVSICAIPVVRQAPGAKALGLFSISDSPPEWTFLGKETGAGFDISSPPELKWSSTGEKVGCFAAMLVSGAAPTLVVSEQTGPVQNQQQRFNFLTSGGWISVNGPLSFPVGGWAPADNSVLLLLQDLTAAGPPPVGQPGMMPPNPMENMKYALYRFRPEDGTFVEACRLLCTSLMLGKTIAGMTALPDPSVAPSEDQQRLFESGPQSMVMLDATGKFFARPDEGDTIVVSLDTGTVIARAPLGRPVLLESHRIGLISGDGRIRFYKF